MADGYKEKLRNLPAVACTNTFNRKFFFIENKTNKKCTSKTSRNLIERDLPFYI